MKFNQVYIGEYQHLPHKKMYTIRIYFKIDLYIVIVQIENIITYKI